MWRTSGSPGGSWVPRWKIVTSKPRSSRPSRTWGPDGPVPPRPPEQLPHVPQRRPGRDDAASSVPRPRVGAVQDEEVGEAGDHRAEGGPGVVVPPQLPPRDADARAYLGTVIPDFPNFFV